MISMILAVDKNNGLGKNNKLPWHFKEDMKYFRKITWGHTVIMGRKTYESLPSLYRPLPGRKNVVLTANDSYVADKEVKVIKSVEEIKDLCNDKEECFVIGGASVYKLLLPLAQKLYVTHINASYDVDTFLPFNIDDHFVCISEKKVIENGIELKFCIYSKKSK